MLKTLILNAEFFVFSHKISKFFFTMNLYYFYNQQHVISKSISVTSIVYLNCEVDPCIIFRTQKASLFATRVRVCRREGEQEEDCIAFGVSPRLRTCCLWPRLSRPYEDPLLPPLPQSTQRRWTPKLQTILGSNRQRPRALILQRWWDWKKNVRSGHPGRGLR